jgi:ASPM-SPD-2-Hydin domain-containing protein
MNSATLRIIALVVLGSCALSGCGGGGSPGVPPSPSVSFSASNLTFGDETEGTASEPLLITLTNTGTAALTITSIAASANFAETNNCGLTLAAGANCAINVTLAPDTTGGVKGTVTFTDNAAGSPQTVSLTGTAVKSSTLTGYCLYYTGIGPCGVTSLQEPGECPVGQPAVAPAGGYCNGGGEIITDTSTLCSVPGTTREHGSCQATSAVGSCSVQGQQCGAAGSSPCCSGFACTAGAEGSLCQPTTGTSAGSRRRSSSWSQGLADRLR